MGSIITLGIHYLKLLFKSKSLLLLLFCLPLCISALVTCGLQNAYVPAVNYLKKNKSEQDTIKYLSGKAHDAGQLIKEQSNTYKTLKNKLEDSLIDLDVPEIAEYATQNFLSVLLPSYYPIIGNLINNSLISLNTIILIILSIGWLPAIVGVFLMNQDKKNQTLYPIIAQGISSSQFILSKIFAGFLISCLITVASLAGYVIGAYFASKYSSFAIEINMEVIKNLSMMGIIGSFCAITLTIFLAQIITENKTQIVICGMLVPLLIIAIFIGSIKKPLIDSGVSEIQDQIPKIKTERIAQDKKKFPLLAERQILDYSQMFAEKIGSDLIPQMLRSLPRTSKTDFSDSILKALNTFSIISLISIILAMSISFISFRKQ